MKLFSRFDKYYCSAHLQLIVTNIRIKVIQQNVDSSAVVLSGFFLIKEADLSKVLYWPAMSDQEFRQVDDIASLLNQALVDIQVESSEPLVVDFGTSL